MKGSVYCVVVVINFLIIIKIDFKVVYDFVDPAAEDLDDDVDNDVVDDVVVAVVGGVAGREHAATDGDVDDTTGSRGIQTPARDSHSGRHWSFFGRRWWVTEKCNVLVMM